MMNADVNITLSVQNEHDAEDTQQASSNISAERHNGADVAIASTNKETPEESSCILTDSCTEWLGENGTQEIAAATQVSPNTTADRDVDYITKKIAKLAIKSGTWSCNQEFCKDDDNVDMLSCGRWKGKRHYGCTNLPIYQISLFVSKSYKKKFICE